MAEKATKSTAKRASSQAVKKKPTARKSSPKKPATKRPKKGSITVQSGGISITPDDMAPDRRDDPQLEAGDETTLALQPLDLEVQPFLAASTARRTAAVRSINPDMVAERVQALELRPTVSREVLAESVQQFVRRRPEVIDLDQLPDEIAASQQAARPQSKRLHGGKFLLPYFPPHLVNSPCANKFGYLSTAKTRKVGRLPFTTANRTLLSALADEMGTVTGSPQDSVIPAGYTYAGQFIDHDITLDVSSSLDTPTNANRIFNMRTPSLDLDNVYRGGPALDPHLYDVPSMGANPTAIRMRLGTNTTDGVGGPGGPTGGGGTAIQPDFDVPRLGSSPFTALIGDPRNDENLIVSQFQHAMLRFHNAVVDLLEIVPGSFDIFIEARKTVRHHYQWAVVNDFLVRVCGPAAVADALGSVVAPVNGPFRMPVEFAVGAYRFGHSMIRDNYWLSFRRPSASLSDVFARNREPNLPVLSSWVVDFNAFFDTGISVPVNNLAHKIDSNLANGLQTLPGFTGLLANLARRNLLRGLALGVPSGQALANQLGVPKMTTAELTAGLPAGELAALSAGGGVLLKKTPLWYYCLREAAFHEMGNHLGPLGARIVARTFVRMLKRDPDSYLNASTPFSPWLPSKTPGEFDFGDLVNFAGVTDPN